MRIVIVVVSSAENLSGVPRHAVNMARSLLTRPEITAVHLIAAQWQCETLRDVLPLDDPRLILHPVSIGRSAISRNLWYYNQLPILAAQLRADVVHLAYPVPVKRRAFFCPTIVTLHDLYPYDIPANFGFPKVLVNRIILQQCLREVDAIACVSESTLNRLDVYGQQLALQKAVTIHNCVEPGPAVTVDASFPGWDGEPFLLCVAQHRRNKNILLALKVFHRLLDSQEINSSTRFVLIGIEGPETARIRSYIRSAGLSQHVVLLRGVSEAELHWCYAHCELLLAPSIVEGFGLPIVEAMMHQCRIVCSDIPAFREVGGSSCRYVSLKPPAEDAFVLATAMELKTVRFRASSTDRFSGARVAEAYIQLYQLLRTGRSAKSSPSSYPLVPSLESPSLKRKSDHERLI
jgi:glycosyltransferase involved in cell wall biosynthesis